MNRTGKHLVISALALMVATGTAFADSKSAERNRKTSFFDRLFKAPSKSTTEKRKRRTLFGSNWWDSGYDSRVVNGQENARKRRNVARLGDGDPEGDPGIGMGNLTYAPDQTQQLAGLKFAETRPLTPDAAAIYDALTAPESTARVIPAIRETLAEHYRQQGFKPLWIKDGQLAPRATAMLKVMSEADAEGLEAARYLPPSLSTFDATPPSYDPAAMARLDVEITAMALRYAREASGGQFDPRRLSLYNDITPSAVAPSLAMKILAWSPFPAEYLKSLQPTHEAYAAMKVALAELRAQSETAPPPEPIADGKIVKVGKSDERIDAVRQRLADLGYPGALMAEGLSEVLDADLSAQLRLFQKASGIKPTGLLGPQTVAALNDQNQNREREIAKLLDNMERMRWLPKSLGSRYVFVNQAAFEVRVMDNGREVWQSRVIVGRPMTQTAAFHDEIETVVFNPSWGVPQSIIVNEYLPKLRNDPNYLDRMGFKVVNAQGRVVSSDSVDWWGYSTRSPVGIQQPPGSDNALGELKFLFPNSHDIYMHDTPSRQLFDKDERAFSHGCVRVENPREFATILLGWDPAKVDDTTDSGRSQSIKLPEKVPVHITYFTAWPDESGKIRYFNDIYDRDKTMDNARSAITLAQR